LSAATLSPDPGATGPSSDVVAVQRIEAELNDELLERDDAIRAALLALLSQSHLVLLGPARNGQISPGHRSHWRFVQPRRHRHSRTRT
jgi:hypothetical protein